MTPTQNYILTSLISEEHIDLYCNTDELSFELIKGEFNELLLYHGDILLRKWSSNNPKMIISFFSEFKYNPILSYESELFLYYANNPEIATIEDFDFIYEKNKNSKDVSKQLLEEIDNEVIKQILNKVG